MAKKKCEILVINQIAQVGLKRFPAERYAVVKESKDPWAILVRSQDLHKFEFGPSLRAVGRAGAGVNNIPVPALSKRGIPVFNAPGANANAVKELVLAGMLIAARNLGPALDFVRNLDGNGDLNKTVEGGKKQFAGFELPGHTLGVIGLGKIGSLVADTAIRLGMNVLGYDPHITVESAWSLFDRAVIGSYHKLSKKHLPAYLDEFAFHYNHRKDERPMFRAFLENVRTASALASSTPS